MSLVDDLLTDLEENTQVDDDNASCYPVKNKRHGLIMQNRALIPGCIKIDGSTESYSIQDIAQIFRGGRLKDAMTEIDNFFAQNGRGRQSPKWALQEDPEYGHIAEVN